MYSNCSQCNSEQSRFLSIELAQLGQRARYILQIVLLRRMSSQNTLACGLEGSLIEWISDFLSKVLDNLVVNQFLFLSLPSAFSSLPSATTARIFAPTRLGIAARGRGSKG